MNSIANFSASIIYAVEFGISVHSCFITEEEKEKVLELREEKRIEKEFEEEVLKSPSMAPMSAGMIPRTPGFPPLTVQPIARHGAPISPFTPRHLAFNRLGNGSTSSDLPLRDNSSMPTPQIPCQPQTIESQVSPSQPMYFPPPPKKATKN